MDWAISCGDLAHRVHQRQRLRDGLRHLREQLELAGDLVAVLRAAGLRQREPDQVVGRDLGEERLGGGDADLRAGVRVEHGVGLARDLRAVGVAHGEHPGPLPAGVPDGLQGVGGLAGLADRDDQRVAVENRVAVTELAGDLDLDRQPASSARWRTWRPARSGRRCRRRRRRPCRWCAARRRRAAARRARCPEPSK